MRILFVASAFLPDSTGGTELHAFQLAKELAREHEVRIVTRGGRGDIDDYVVDRYAHEGLQVQRINYCFRDAQTFEWIYSNARIDAIVGRELDEFRPDLVHIHHLTCLSTGIIDQVKDRGIALVLTLHDFWMFCPRGQRIDSKLEICETVDRQKCESCLAELWPHFFPEARAHGWFAKPAADRLARWDEHVRRVLARCDLLITPSEFHREKILEFALPEERLVALAHGLDVERLRRRRDPDGPIKTIGFIGTVIPSKGVHVLVEAFVGLRDPSLALEIWGEAPSFHGDVGYAERLREMVPADLGIRMRGRYRNADLPEILANIDLLVVPSLWWETYCLTIFEGLLSGAVVLAADHGAMREALKGGGEGLLFEPGSAADLQAKIRTVRDDAEIRRRYRNRNAWIKSLETHAREMKELYRRALVSAGRDPIVLDRAGLALAAPTGGAGERPLRPGDPVPNWRASKNGPPVTVFIPTWNGGALFDKVLAQVRAQKTDFDYELLCIDSGSRDQTVDLIRKWGARLIAIPNSEFNHGLTRNRAVQEAKGEIVALLTQDAVPWNDAWLANLVSNFDDAMVAGAYCHQLPREDCNPFQLDRLRGWTYGEAAPVVKRMTSRADYEAMTPMERYRLIAFDDVASAVRKAVMRSIPFERRQFGEDVAWAKQAILAGWKIVMDPRAVVVHSHNNPIWYEFKRVYLDHQNLNDLVGMHLVPRFADALRFTVDGTRHLAAVVRKAGLPKFEEWMWLLKTPFYSLGQNMGQYLGARSVIAKRKGIFGFIDRRLRKGV